MKQMAIISGKGGTGKTTVTASLAELWENKVLVDCDVDASNLNLLFCHKENERQKFYSGYKADLDLNLCTSCGKCREVCRFEAITKKYQIDGLSCTGCGACKLVCSAEAIELLENLAGEWFISETTYGPLVHAALGIAEDNSGKLVSQIRQIAREMAEKKGHSTIIIDGPPGIGCPVIAAITNVDLVLAVTEPTLSGLYDLKRVFNLTKSFETKCVVCINKYDLNPEMSDKIIDFCKKNAVAIVGKIPFDKKVINSMININTGSSFFKTLPEHIKESLYDLSKQIHHHI